MKALKVAFTAVLALLALSTVSPPVEAHGRIRGGIVLHFGLPWYWWPRYYDPGWYYYPPPTYPVTVIERGPITYIERGDVAEDDALQARAPTYWWYWCAEARKYYPYVKDCPGGWRRVPPQPSR